MVSSVICSIEESLLGEGGICVVDAEVERIAVG